MSPCENVTAGGGSAIPPCGMRKASSFTRGRRTKNGCFLWLAPPERLSLSAQQAAKPRCRLNFHADSESVREATGGGETRAGDENTQGGNTECHSRKRLTCG